MPAPSTRPAGSAGALRLGMVAGVPVRVSVTTVFLVVVLTVALVPQIDRARPGLGPLAYVVGALVGVTVYVAVLVHELAHAVAARRYGHRVDSITLSIVGGRTVVEGEAATAREELVTAAAGPVASLLVGALALGALGLTGDGLAAVVLEVVVLANLVLGLLDLVPAPPMDGGRLVKAAGWRLTGSARQGSVAAAHSGRVVAVGVLVATLVVLPLLTDRPPLTTTLIGVALAVLLWLMATNELAVARLRLQVGDVVVRDLVRRTLAVPPDLPLAEALRRGQEAGAPGLVTTDAGGRVLGVVSEAALAEVPEERRAWVPVSDATTPLAAEHRLPADITGDELLSAIRRAPVAEYLLVDDAGGVVGVLSLNDLDRQVRGR
jgi:Zn-dependent protease